MIVRIYRLQRPGHMRAIMCRIRYSAARGIRLIPSRGLLQMPVRGVMLCSPAFCIIPPHLHTSTYRELRCMQSGTTTTKGLMTPIGKLIKEELQAQERSVSWFARKLHLDRSNVYRLFQKNSIDTDLLSRISIILGRNFFEPLSDNIRERNRTPEQQ